MRLVSGLLAATAAMALSILSAQPTLAQVAGQKVHHVQHAKRSVHNNVTPCEKDLRCSESLSRAAAYGYLNSPRHRPVHR
jgi:hypothetical protein